MKKLFSIILCGLMSVGMLYAQSDENKLQKIKNAFQSELFQLSGYAQIQYNINEYPERSLSSGTANNSIDVTRAILIASGKLGVKQQIGYMLMFDFGPSAKLIELYGEWSPSKAINLRFGQCKVPFTIENPMSLTRIETINPTRSMSALNGGSGDFNQFEPDGKKVSKTGRDAGLVLSGALFPTNNFSLLEYYAGLFNGTGMNTKDNNNRKDFVGAAYLYPIKEFKLGGSVYSGEYPKYMAVNLPSDELSIFRWAIGAEYKGARFCGRAEYMSSKDGDLKRNGYYGLLVWKFVPNRWEAVGKYDNYNPNTLFDDSSIHDLTFGVNYYFAHLSRIQLNYIYSEYQGIGRNNAVAMQLQLFF
jgi:hypothetical protein